MVWKPLEGGSEEKMVGSFSGLTIGTEYTLEVEEDPEIHPGGAQGGGGAAKSIDP